MGVVGTRQYKFGIGIGLGLDSSFGKCEYTPYSVMKFVVARAQY